jgi:hypothetical protein
MAIGFIERTSGLTVTIHGNIIIKKIKGNFNTEELSAKMDRNSLIVIIFDI